MLLYILETLKPGFTITAFAVIIVVVLLIVLLSITIFQSRLLRERMPEKPAMPQNVDSEVVTDLKETVETNDMKSQNTDDMEIVAAIVAAISAYTNLSSSEFRIKGIKRVSGNDSPWRNSGIIQ